MNTQHSSHTEGYQEEVEVVADLDALLPKPVAFRLHGKDHVIKPLSAGEFLKFANSVAKFFNMKDNRDLTEEEVNKRKFFLFRRVIPTLSMDDIQKMSPLQTAGLFEIVMSAVMGKDPLENEKKKTLIDQMKTPHWSGSMRPA